jgi:hypothetical protein
MCSIHQDELTDAMHLAQLPVHNVYNNTNTEFSFANLCKLEGAGVAQSVQCLTTDWTAGVWSPTEAEDFSP